MSRRQHRTNIQTDALADLQATVRRLRAQVFDLTDQYVAQGFALKLEQTRYQRLDDSYRAIHDDRERWLQAVLAARAENEALMTLLAFFLPNDGALAPKETEH